MLLQLTIYLISTFVYLNWNKTDLHEIVLYVNKIDIEAPRKTETWS